MDPTRLYAHNSTYAAQANTTRDNQVDAMMKALHKEALDLKLEREKRDARPRAHEIAQRVARVSGRVPQDFPGRSADAFLAYRGQTSETPTTYSAVVMARFAASPSRAWLHYDGKLSPDDVNQFREGKKFIEQLVPENAYALSVAGWSQLGYLHIEKIDTFYMESYHENKTKNKMKCVAYTRIILQAAKDAFATADRLESTFNMGADFYRSVITDAGKL
ncbi:hypothetical protein AURDEDRAFT_130388 [Auricularia subglabra TFB-10046 SS5]|nr:hypothetical protein AURDEDRAFT_130388 [Auricularia subglabra TFB-10046 SS5]